MKKDRKQTVDKAGLPDVGLSVLCDGDGGVGLSCCGRAELGRTRLLRLYDKHPLRHRKVKSEKKAYQIAEI